MRITIFDNIDRRLLEQTLAHFTEVSIEENPDLVIVRSKKLHDITIPESVYAIARAGSGIDNIPISQCNKKGIVVFNAPGANANAVHESTIEALLLSSKNTAEALSYINNLPSFENKTIEADKKRFTGIELRGKRILIIGSGNIGRLVAQTCQALGMMVTIYDPYTTPEKTHCISSLTTPKDILVDFDFITLHCPLNEETKSLINYKLLTGAKEGVIIVNFARSEIVDINGMRQALENNIVKTYISDFPDGRLRDFDSRRVIFLPHLGAATYEAQRDAITMVAEQLKEFWKTGKIYNSVNFPDLQRTLKDGKQRLLVCNRNIPRMIAKITEALGDAGYNVSGMENDGKGEIAYNIIDVDSNSKDNLKNVLEKIRAVQGVTKVRLIKS